MKKAKRRIIIIAAILLCAAIIAVVLIRCNSGGGLSQASHPTGSFDPSQDFVKIMDVGQGDGILIYSNGCSAVIDTGVEDAADDILQDLAAAQIKDIDALIISHLHMDHAGGLPEITKRHSIDNLILPALSDGAEAAEYAEISARDVKAGGGTIYTAVQGMNFKIGEFSITVLAHYDNMENENNKSVIVMAEIDGTKFLFTGDAESKTEQALLREGLNLDCDVLKVGHHGSNTSSCDRFLKAATPDYAAISVGEDNMYYHPHRKILSALKERGAEIFRTDNDGDIVFYVEKGKIRVETEK